MKIINRTHFVTADLRAILTRVAADELDVEKRKRTVVEVRYARTRGTCSGWAWIGGTHCVVRLNKHLPAPDRFAKVAAHEFAHLRGMRHRNMPIRYKWTSPTWEARYAWATALGIRVQSAAPKARIDNADKLDHAIRMHARAVTRVKRAQTIERTWRAKVRYHTRRLEQPRRAADSPMAEG